MKTVQYPGLDSEMGLIWYGFKAGGESVIGHNGGDYGVSTEMGFTSDGTGFVVLMNGEGTDYTLPDIERAMLRAAEGL